MTVAPPPPPARSKSASTRAYDYVLSLGLCSIYVSLISTSELASIQVNHKPSIQTVWTYIDRFSAIFPSKKHDWRLWDRLHHQPAMLIKALHSWKLILSTFDSRKHDTYEVCMHKGTSKNLFSRMWSNLVFELMPMAFMLQVSFESHEYIKEELHIHVLHWSWCVCIKANDPISGSNFNMSQAMFSANLKGEEFKKCSYYKTWAIKYFGKSSTGFLIVWKLAKLC